MKTFLLFFLLFITTSLNAQVNSRIIGLLDSVICLGDSIKAFSLSGEVVQWYGNKIDSVLASQIQVALDSTTWIKARTPIPTGYGPNLLFNGNFALGDTGFYTALNPRSNPCEDYSYELVPHSSCGVVDGPALNISPTDSLMFHIKEVASSTVLWSQDVKVIQHQFYSFTYWTRSFQPTDMILVSVSINGKDIAPVHNIAKGFSWIQHTYNWYSSDNNVAIISINKVFGCGFGWPTKCRNNFAIDDIRFNLRVDPISQLPVQYDSIKVSVRYPPFDGNNIWVEDSMLCRENVTVLNINSNFGSVLWQDGSTKKAYTTTQTGLYWFTARNKNGCRVSDSMFVHFNDLSSPNIERNGRKLFTNAPAKTYTWILNDEIIPDSDTASIELNGTGLYRLILSNESGCTKQSGSYVYMPPPTSVDDIENSISIYPNPASDKIFLSGAEQGLTYRIISLQGQLLKEGLTSGHISIIDLPAGIYILEISNKNTPIYRSKWAKN